MTSQHILNAQKLLKERTLPELVALWDMTEKSDDPNIPVVRGWIMDELEARNPEAFDKWIDGDGKTESLKRLFFQP